MAPNLIRTLKKGDKGPDVLAMGRALIKAGFKLGVIRNQRFGGAKDKQLRRFQKAQKLPADGVYGQRTHNKLWPYVDDFGKSLFSKAPKMTPEEKKYNELLMWCEKVNAADPPYVWGGAHGVDLDKVVPGQGMDCSSSCSYVLHKAGLFEPEQAWVSGTMANVYGWPGQGKFYTVYAHSTHVFIRLHKGKWWRFDTSPHGDGGRGPELRRLPRFTRGFYARHLGGM